MGPAVGQWAEVRSGKGSRSKSKSRRGSGKRNCDSMAEEEVVKPKYEVEEISIKTKVQKILDLSSTRYSSISLGRLLS